jgi:AcrR family transcriptional regulator
VVPRVESPSVVKPPRTPVDKLARRVAKTSQRVVGVPRPRRTQAERRAATRGALLDAALDCLVEDGYVNFTTRRVAERAGVSQGTQQHYFASKTDFVVEAMRHATQQITDDVLRRVDIRALYDPAEQEELLDQLWSIHRSPAFKAFLELWIAARTDVELRRNMRKLEREITQTVDKATQALLSGADAGSAPRILAFIDFGLATLRGYALLSPVVPNAELERRWKAARAMMLEVLRSEAARVR